MKAAFLCSALLWLMKLLGFLPPPDAVERFLNLLWDLNMIRLDPVVESTDLMDSYIRKFNLDASYWTHSKSSELFFSNTIREFEYFKYLRAIQVPQITYGGCQCSPNGSVVQGSYIIKTFSCFIVWQFLIAAMLRS